MIYHQFMQFTLCSLLFKVTWPNQYQIWKFVEFQRVKVSVRLWLGKYWVHLMTWSKRVSKFIISINLGKFGLNTMYKYHVLVQVWFESEFYKSLTMNYHLQWGANLVIFSFCGTTLLDQSHSNPSNHLYPDFLMLNFE